MPEHGGPAEWAAAGDMARGLARFFQSLGYRSLAEFRLQRARRRADLFAINRDGHIVLVEIKTSRADYRSDGKWEDYLDFCDAFYFAVPPGFPREVLPAAHGLIVADAWSAEILRPAEDRPLNAARRRNLILRFALDAAARLHALEDPRL